MVAFPLLETKLYVPPLQSAWISRTRLLNRLNEGFERKFTLLSAPAGYGKTTLLVEWIHQNKIPVAWFSVDQRDNDLTQFLTYVIAGLQTLDAEIGKAALKMLQSPQPPPFESILINLINSMSRMQTDAALFLDDYHAVDAKPIHDLLAFLLDHLPNNMHLVIATRSDPPFLLARLRSQNQLTDLRAADLIFTTNETAELLTKG